MFFGDLSSSKDAEDGDAGDGEEDDGAAGDGDDDFTSSYDRGSLKHAKRCFFI